MEFALREAKIKAAEQKACLVPPEGLPSTWKLPAEATRSEPEEHPAQAPSAEDTPTSAREVGAVEPNPSELNRSLATGAARESIPDGPFGSIVKAEGVTIKVTGATPRAMGNSYEQGIRETFGNGGDRHVFEDGVGYVDDIIADGEQAFEAKYTNNFDRSLYNPDYNAVFPHKEVEETVNQFTKLANHFNKGVVIFTNSQELASAYNLMLSIRQVAKYRFFIAPATR